MRDLISLLIRTSGSVYLLLGGIMEIALIIAMLVVGYFWWAKKRLKSKMHRLLNAAKLTSYGIFTLHIADSPAEDQSEPSHESMIAAASVNFLFGKAPSALHESLNLREIHTDAVEWLKRDDMLRELIVQSLRVTAQLGFMENGAVAIRGEGILKTFGPEYPLAPNPDSYENLVRKAMGALSPDMQATIRSRFSLLSHE